MNFKRIGRILVCLVLVCCLLVHISPIKAEATGSMIAGSAFISVAAANVIASMLIGDGILPSADTSVFNGLVSDLESYFTDLGVVSNGLMDVLRITGAKVGQDEFFAIPQSYAKQALDFAYDTGIISSSITNGYTVPSGTWILGTKNDGIMASVDATCFLVKSGTVGCNVWLVSESPFTAYTRTTSYHISGTIYEEASISFTYNDRLFYYSYYGVWATDAMKESYLTYSVDTETIGKLMTGEITIDGAASISLIDGLTQGAVIGSNVIPFPEVYEKWAEQSFEHVESPDSEKQIPWVPIALGSSYEDTISKTQEDVWNGISEYTSSVLSNWDRLLNYVSAIRNGISTIANTISISLETLIDEIIDAVKAIPSAFETWFAELKNYIEAIPGAFEAWFQTVIQVGQSILDTVITIPQAIADAIVEALAWAFSLDEAYVQSEFESLVLEFKFLDSMVDFGRGVADIFYGIGSEPPVIYIDLSAAEGSYILGQEVVFLDLSWYSRFKPYGDAIISSFLWAWFGWRLLHNIPGLINGSSGVVPHINFRK
ncbi:MAG: hypothetical protein IJO21_02485 [Oscillospiraceae bacterium]|nr:hypothetical protein [Oscillospiraceae bacterium]